MGWKTVEITQDDYLQLHLNNLYIKRGEKKLILNISDIDTLIIDSYSATVSVRLIQALVNENVNVIITDYKHDPSAFIVPVNGNHMSLKVLEKQIQWTKIYRNTIWKGIISNKILNQAMHLARLKLASDEDLNMFMDFADSIQELDITNREGHAAKLYWKLLFGEDFVRDQKAEQFPIINSMLNYAYSILRSYYTRSIVKKGLDPRISIFHKSISNFFSLASDLMEPMRVYADSIVYEFKDEPIFTLEIRNQIIEAFTKKILYNENYQYINNLIDKSVDVIVRGEEWKDILIWE